ncbi:HAUS augmin-like complex subunit 4 isoform X1 [Electrophorus electricus]|uniref:HAUS augmin-like complex, subunit 4 n=2 Tax=Electrophorus electricus TaxID=8005 RepID=A0A4W4EWY8_ELEEL|nr:HAUS augmin-like complex subunit 4 isoform X1 [Electrophorus electricus]
MLQCPDSVCGSYMGKGDSLHHQVLAAFPLCHMTEEDLIQNPLFCKVLATLSQHVDRTGLTLHLKKELEKAQKELRSQRLGWLRMESLHRLLQEMVQEHRSSQHHSGTPTAGDKFYATLEQCLLVAKCMKRLDASRTVDQNRSPFLGLSAEEVLHQMPCKQDVLQMKQRLPTELQKHLKKKLFYLLSYYQPEWENESEGLRCVKLTKLPGLLAGERVRADNLAEKNRENALSLQRQTHSYLLELLECMQLLQTLVLDLRLKVQKDLDRKKIEYFEAKCEIGIQKIRAEMLAVQLDTYTRDKIAAHWKITEKLGAELQAAQLEKHSLESKLASFEIYGKEFEALAAEYCRLREEITTRSWALKEFTA